MDTRRHIRFSSLILNIETQVLSREDTGQWEQLPNIEFDLLHYMACHPGKTLTRDELMLHLWGKHEKFDGYAQLHSYMSKIRKKLRSLGIDPDSLILTRSVEGYVFQPKGTLTSPNVSAPDFGDVKTCILTQAPNDHLWTRVRAQVPEAPHHEIMRSWTTASEDVQETGEEVQEWKEQDPVSTLALAQSLRGPAIELPRERIFDEDSLLFRFATSGLSYVNIFWFDAERTLWEIATDHTLDREDDLNYSGSYPGEKAHPIVVAPPSGRDYFVFLFSESRNVLGDEFWTSHFSVDTASGVRSAKDSQAVEALGALADLAKKIGSRTAFEILRVRHSPR